MPDSTHVDTAAPSISYPDGSIAFAPTPKQLEVLTSSAPWLLVWGNRGGGKSLVCRWKCHAMALTFPNFHYLVVRNTLGELKRTHFTELPFEMEKLGGSFHKTDNIAHYPNGSTGTWVGVDDEAAMMKMLSGQYALIFVDEITTVDWQTVVDVSSCLRVKVDAPYNAQLIAATNPYGPSAEDVERHWITKDLSHAEDPDYDATEYAAIRIQLDDNPHIDAESYRKQLSKQTGQKRAAWLEGSWVRSGNFFSNFEPTRDGQPWHVIKTIPLHNGTPITRHPTLPIYRSVDWGFVDDPCVCLWIAVLPNDRAIVIKEMSWKRTAAIEVAHEIIGHSRGMKIAQTFCDPTMFNGQRQGSESVAERFELAGVPLTPSVNQRQVYGLHEYLSTTLDDDLPMIQIWQEGCPELIRTLPMQKPNKLDPERMADSKTDHHALTLGYFCSGGVAGQVPQQPKKVPLWMQPKAGDTLRLGSESVRSRR